MGHDSTGALVVVGSITPKGEARARRERARAGAWHAANPQYTQGTIERMRVRTGMISDTLGFGVRGPVTESTTVKSYMQIWAWSKALSRKRTRSTPRTSGRLTCNWRDLGQLASGAVERVVFSRCDRHRRSLWPWLWRRLSRRDRCRRGPSQGQIGFGLLGSGFAAGVVYATPRLAGFQLTTGAFDPVHLQGAWPRTKWARQRRADFRAPYC